MRPQTTHWEGCEAVHPECKTKPTTAAEMSAWVKDTWEKCQVETWQEQDMTAEELLKLCHAYLRGAEINEPTGRKPIDRDTLARLINLYLNTEKTVGS